MNYMPIVTTKVDGVERETQLPSLLHRERVIYICQEVDEHLANVIVQQLLHLNFGRDAEKDIHMYINSPGGVITHGLAIYDTMRFIKAKVHTYCIGQCASMGAFLLASGTGKRYAMPSSRIMIHQPLGGAQGQATDIQIQAKEIQRNKDFLNEKLSDYCNQSIEVIERDTDRDNFMSAEEALEYGIIDEVIQTK
ncbi:ATP-dependent Clp protease proteolytic subunit [Vibrio crassostreae]|uniref:ATP-dependent Clp protease proteolytic subunit n=1 Tax=Vibrio crassostreae TaxID=246167 RepID=UPI001B318864|nr:ATP-dependent Clp protease proteolytic subunit [Vibrio crassostreae]